MITDWNQLRPGDRVRITFEGTWRDVWDDSPDGWTMFVANDRSDSEATFSRACLTNATSAELIERPFTPPKAGTLFRQESLWISHGDKGFRLVRLPDGALPNHSMDSRIQPWSAMASEWLDDIEVLEL